MTEDLTAEDFEKMKSHRYHTAVSQSEATAFVIEALSETLLKLEDALSAEKTSYAHAMAGQKAAIAERDAYQAELAELQAAHTALSEKYDALVTKIRTSLPMRIIATLAEKHDVLVTETSPSAPADVALKIEVCFDEDADLPFEASQVTPQETPQETPKKIGKPLSTDPTRDIPLRKTLE